MASYLTRLFSNALNQLLLLFGGVFVFAFLLSFVSGLIREGGERVMGRSYYYLVAPGVVCHETGHALGCILTGTKIVEIEPFRPQGNQLGRVTFRPHPPLSPLRALEFVAATGPVWFGCLVIALLTKFLGWHATGRQEQIPSEVLLANGPMESARYWFAVVKSALTRLRGIFHIWHWRNTLNVVYLYLVFCIVSEMTLSTADLEIMWPGFLVICVAFLALNAISPVGGLVYRVVFHLRRFLFDLHSLICFVLLGDVMFLLLFFIPITLIF